MSGAPYLKRLDGSTTNFRSGRHSSQSTDLRAPGIVHRLLEAYLQHRPHEFKIDLTQTTVVVDSVLFDILMCVRVQTICDSCVAMSQAQIVVS